MRKALIALVTIVTLSGCSHKIVRSGYQTPATPAPDCEIAVVKHLVLKDSLQKLGEIELEDSGFSTNCGEKAAMDILRKEGCALDADLVNITEESFPSLMSTCYRCKAQFYRSNGVPGMSGHETVTGADAEPKNLKGAQAAVMVLSYIAGFALGYFLVTLMMN